MQPAKSDTPATTSEEGYQLFGELEFWFSMLKVLAIVAFRGTAS